MASGVDLSVVDVESLSPNDGLPNSAVDPARSGQYRRGSERSRSLHASGRNSDLVVTCQGTESTRSSDFVSLAPYEEIRGRLEAVRYTEQFVIVDLSTGTLRFATDTPQANTCRAELDGQEGALVALLYVPKSIQPLHVRIE